MSMWEVMMIVAIVFVVLAYPMVMVADFVGRYNDKVRNAEFARYLIAKCPR